MPSLRPGTVLREQPQADVCKQLCALLNRLGKLYAIPNWDADSALLLAEWIMEEYKFEQIETVVKALGSPQVNTADKTWRLTPDVIAKWVELEIDRQAAKTEKEKHNEGFKEVKNEWPEERLKEWKELISEVEVKKVPSLSEEDVKREGQERVVKTYHSPDKSYLRELELKVEYGRLHTDLHSGKPKEGAPTYTEWLKTAK